jgi:acyl carrier protein
VIVCPEGIERKVERSRRFTQERVLAELSARPAATPDETVERSLSNEYVAPRNELERRLADLWEEALGVSPVGVDDDFFELGGNSLVAVQLASRVRDRFQIELALPAVFEHPTVTVLAAMVEEALVAKIAGLSEAEAEALVAGSEP